MQFSVIILAGGRASRFGSDKLLYEYRGKTMLERVAEAAVKSGAEEAIMTVKELKDGYDRIAKRLGIKVVMDSLKEFTPLAGLCSGAEAAKSSNVIVISGDSPLVSPEFFRTINSYLEKIWTEAAVPLWPDGRVEVIHAGYRKEPLLDACGRMIKAGDYEVKRVLLYIKSVYLVPVEQVDKNSLIDVDSIDDLKNLDP